jgi:dTMP kinase
VEQNNQARGTFIVLEGTDGSGKGTQLKILVQQLRQAGHQVEVFDFPQYDVPSGYFVKRYLNGDYGTANEVGPYTGALFYALDRYDVADQIRKAITDGKVVIANRYTASSMAHQGAKFDAAEQRRGYFIWLDNLEFETLKIPRPDLNIVLRVPADIAQTLVDQKETRSYTDKQRDLHEADIEHMRKAVAVYDDLCQLFPKDFTRIDCVRSDKLLSVENINKLIAEKVAPLLPQPRPRTAAAAVELPSVAQPAPALDQPKKPVEKAVNRSAKSDFYIPPALDPKTARFFSDSVNELRNRHGRLVTALAAYLRQAENRSEADARKSASVTLRSVLPVTYLDGAPIQPANAAVRGLLNELTQSTHADPGQSIASLAAVVPRNEFDSIPTMLFPQSDLSLRELLNASEDWNYEQKAKILTLFLNDQSAPGDREPLSALDSISYTWDFTTEYQLFAQLYSTKLGRALSWQSLTPRLGFAVPQVIDDADLTDLYEESFDVSLRFYSQLQQKGYDNEAQYAVLLGHKLRWNITYSANEQSQIFAVLRGMDATSVGPLFNAMSEKIGETHPLLAEYLSRAD